MVGYQSDTSMDIHGIFMIVSPNILNNIIYIYVRDYMSVSLKIGRFTTNLWPIYW